MNFQIKTFMNSRIIYGYNCFKTAHNFEKINKAKKQKTVSTQNINNHKNVYIIVVKIDGDNR